MDRSTMKVRLNEIISADKEEIKEETKTALLRDLRYVLGEYFEFGDKMDMEIKRGKNGLEVVVNFHAYRVKNFTLLK